MLQNQHTIMILSQNCGHGAGIHKDTLYGPWCFLCHSHSSQSTERQQSWHQANTILFTQVQYIWQLITTSIKFVNKNEIKSDRFAYVWYCNPRVTCNQSKDSKAKRMLKGSNWIRTSTMQFLTQRIIIAYFQRIAVNNMS